MREIVVIAHDMRSTFNVGSLLRTAEGLGVKEVYFTGYTPYPRQENDSRLPHIAARLDKQIDKTALGASHTVAWQHEEDITALVERLKTAGYEIVALEQAKDSTKMPDYHAPDKVALILGTEVEGLPSNIVALASVVCEIPMFGQKESFNVVQAAAMALYHCRFY